MLLLLLLSLLLLLLLWSCFCWEVERLGSIRIFKIVSCFEDVVEESKFKVAKGPKVLLLLLLRTGGPTQLRKERTLLNLSIGLST